MLMKKIDSYEKTMDCPWMTLRPLSLSDKYDVLLSWLMQCKNNASIAKRSECFIVPNCQVNTKVYISIGESEELLAGFESQSYVIKLLTALFLKSYRGKNFKQVIQHCQTVDIWRKAGLSAVIPLNYQGGIYNIRTYLLVIMNKQIAGV